MKALLTKIAVLSATATLAMSPVVCTAAQTTPSSHVKHHAKTCQDKILCAKLDRLSANMTKGFDALGDSVTQQQTANADFQSKSLALSLDSLTSLKAIQAQGTEVQHAILLSYDDKPLAVDENADTTATKACTDAGFKAGKPVDVSKRHGLFSSGNQYLKSVVCTY